MRKSRAERLAEQSERIRVRTEQVKEKWVRSDKEHGKHQEWTKSD